MGISHIFKNTDRSVIFSPSKSAENSKKGRTIISFSISDENPESRKGKYAKIVLGSTSRKRKESTSKVLFEDSPVIVQGLKIRK